jgi:hypothetical protein
MRIDNPTGQLAALTGSFSGSFTGVGNLTGLTADSVEYANVDNKPTLVSGSVQIDITQTTGYSSFSSSIASDIAGLDGEYATDAELLAVSGALAADIAQNASNFAGLDSDLSTFSVPASTTISSFGASLVDDVDATAAKTTLGLENVTNESKATMFSSPTFTGTVSGVTATHVGLGNVTNESKATMFTDAALTGTPTAPTAATSTDTTQIATTEFVQNRIAEVIDSAPAALDTLNELAAALGDDPNLSGSLATTISTKLAKASNLSDLTDASVARTNLGLGNVENTALSTGNAGSATKLATARTIAGVSFDGTANISLNNNAITNGAGYTTYSANQGLDNDDNVHFEGLMVGQTTGATANTIRCVGDVVAYYSSDAQFKDNVVKLEGALDKVKQIRGVEFDWNDKQDVYEGHDIGVIAQEVQAVYPELVHHRDHSDSLAVDYVKLTAVLIEAVKELSAKVDELSK